MVKSFEQIKTLLSVNGTVLLSQKESPLGLEEWELLDRLTSPESAPYELVKTGDVGEAHVVQVARFMTDVDKPRLVNDLLAQKVLDILDSTKMRTFFRRLLGCPQLYLRRCQVHILSEGRFVGYHVDTDSNPDYLSPVVLQFGSAYEGGDYLVHHPEQGPLTYKAPRFSMIVSRCNLAHEVTPVTKGQRRSLVFFLSESSGINRRFESELLEAV